MQLLKPQNIIEPDEQVHPEDALVDRIAALAAAGTPDSLEEAGRLLAEVADTFSSRADRQLVTEALLEAFNGSSPAIRARICEELRSVSKLDRPLQELLVSQLTTSRHPEEWSPIFEPALEALKAHADAESRARLMDAIFEGRSRLGDFFVGTSDPDELVKLNRGRHDDDESIRLECHIALKNTADPEIAEQLLSEFVGGAQLHRAELARTLGGKNAPRFIDALTAEMNKVSELEELAGSVLAGGWRAFRRFRYGQSSIRSQAAEALSGCQNPAAIAALVDGLASPDWNLREACAKALKGTTVKKAQEALLALTLSGKDGFNDGDAKLAAQSLQGCALPEITKKLVAFVKTSNISSEQSYALLALDGTRDPAAQDSMREWLDDPFTHPQNRLICARSLRGRDTAEATTSLIRVLGHNWKELAVEAALSLEGAGLKSIREIMVAEIEKSGNLRVARVHADYLSRQGYDANITGKLLAGLSGDSDVCRFASALALRGHPDSEIRDVLRNGLNKPDIRFGCACALGPGSEQCIQILRDGILSREGSPDFRHERAAACIRALCEGLI